MRKSQGISLVELMVVVGIISLVSAISIPSYSRIKPAYELYGQRKNLVSHIRQAQENAVTTQLRHKLRFEASNYSLIKINDDNTEATIWIKSIAPDVQIQVNLTNSELIFLSDGSLSYGGEIDLTSRTGKQKKIIINTIGNIREE